MQKLLIGWVLGASAALGGCTGATLDSYEPNSSSGTQTSRPATGTTSSTGVASSMGSPSSTGAASSVGTVQSSQASEDHSGASSAGNTGATNPFTVTAHDPWSTFAADVDTASYDIFKRDLQNDNRLPNPDSVRLEEYVNYFAYDYLAPAPSSDHPFHITIDSVPSVFDRATKLVRVGLQGEVSSDLQSKPANLVFLVDVSGSMYHDNKLELAKFVLTQSLDHLKDEDTVSIVTFAAGDEVMLPPTPVSERETIISVIDSLVAEGSTNGGNGIKVAYQEAQAGFREDGINHVVLCSDGAFNLGLTGNALVDYIETKRASLITFTALGFGSSGLDDETLERISNAGNGVYSVISSQAAAEEYVQNRLLSNLYFIAKDVKIQVAFNPEKVAAYRLLGYENRNIADDEFTDDTVDAGEVGAGHRVTALYEIALDINDVPMPVDAPALVDGADFEGELDLGNNELVQVRVRYKLPNATIDDAAFAMSASLLELPANGDDGVPAADSDLQWAAAVAAIAEILKESPYADSKALDAIEHILAEHHNDSPERLEFKALVSKARALLQPVDEAVGE